MRPDQVEYLRNIRERVADALIRDADPEQWPGGTKPSADCTREERGDRQWILGTAIKCAVLYERVASIVERQEAFGKEPNCTAEEDIDLQIAASERAAKKLLARVQTRMEVRDERNAT